MQHAYNNTALVMLQLDTMQFCDPTKLMNHATTVANDQLFHYYLNIRIWWVDLIFLHPQSRLGIHKAFISCTNSFNNEMQEINAATW